MATATPLSASDIQKQMAANSAAWKTATPQMQTQLHDQNMALAAQTGQSYDSGTGTYSSPTKTVTTPDPSRPTYNVPNPATPPKNPMLTAAPIPQEVQKQAPVMNMPVAANTQQTAPQSQGSYPGQLTTAQINAEAQARIDKQRAALMNAVTGAKTGAKNTYDYTQGLQKDNRVLEDASFQRNNNPFSGGTDYKQAMVNRDRQIADTASAKDYNNTIAGYDAQVASFDTLAPEQQQAAVDELTRIERQYGIDLSAVTGQINGQNTMQQNQNNFNNGIAQGNLTGVYNGPTGSQSQGQGVAAQSSQPQGVQTLASKQLAMQQQGQTFNQNQTTKEFAYTQARDAIKDKQYQQTFDNDVKMQGLEYALKQATLKNQITNDQAQRLISQQNADTASNSSKNSNANMQQDNLMNIWKATGKAPAGITGVTEGTPYTGQAAPKPVTVDPKSSTEAYTNYKDQIDASTYTKAQKLAFAASVKGEMTDSDYAKLVAGIQ